MMNVAVVVPAAGSGRRMGEGGIPKAFIDLAGAPMLLHTLRPFLADPRVTTIVIALRAEDLNPPPAWLHGMDPRVQLVAGGTERMDSVRLALQRVPEDVDVVLVHDGARPLVTPEVIARAIDAAARGHSAVAGVPVTDTIQVVDEEGRITHTPDRRSLWHAQTPQAFPRAVLVEAYRRAALDPATATDDATLVARMGAPVYIIEGDRANMKVTTAEDLAAVEARLRSRER
jgi:2-C-methyl-D-erythritol 4-phosphate cytidylyltransferase